MVLYMWVLEIVLRVQISGVTVTSIYNIIVFQLLLLQERSRQIFCDKKVMFLHLFNNKKVEVKCSNFKCITLIENRDKKIIKTTKIYVNWFLFIFYFLGRESVEKTILTIIIYIIKWTCRKARGRLQRRAAKKIFIYIILEYLKIADLKICLKQNLFFHCFKTRSTISCFTTFVYHCDQITNN